MKYNPSDTSEGESPCTEETESPDASDAEETGTTRRALVTAGASVALAGLAGCSELQEGSTEFSADPVVLDESARSEAGYTESVRQTITEERSASAGDFEGTVTINSEVSIYASEQESEPLDVEGLWSESDAALAAWSGGRPVRSVPASEGVDDDEIQLDPEYGPSLGSVPAEALRVWVPDGESPDGPGGLVASPFPEPVAWEEASVEEGSAHAFDNRWFYPGGAPDDGVGGLAFTPLPTTYTPLPVAFTVPGGNPSGREDGE